MTAWLTAVIAALIGLDEEEDAPHGFRRPDPGAPMRRCRYCKRWFDGNLRMDFCPHCGADMEEPNGNAPGR